MAKRVKEIPATLNPFNSTPIASIKRRRVAGYARVSTDREEQATSYDAQVDYYTKYINANPEWEFVGIYTDEGISATNTKHRDGFKQMVEDALAGKIDLIITKSVSRFARNTVDSLTTVRELKEKGVEIFFEKESIWTLDSKGELLITIMSSLAQEESRSISENTTWGKRKSFADGKASVAFSRFLGYDKGPNGEFVINEEQAETVRLIYKLYLMGYSHYAIAKKLTEMGRKTATGKDKWHCSAVMGILQNEKYKGDALLQKQYTSDFLTKKKKKNRGEVPQYYVEGHHEGIVTSEVFDQVQAEIERRSGIESYSGVGIFSSIIKCGECGSFYGSKVVHSNDKYRKIMYRCNHKYQGEKCKTPSVSEDTIIETFLKATKQLISDKDEIIDNTKLMMETICDTTSLEKEQETSITELNIIAEQMQKAIAENSRKALNQEEYEQTYKILSEKYVAAKDKYDEATASIEKKKSKKVLFKAFIKNLEDTDSVIEEFDEELWCNLVQEVVVKSKGHIVIVFKNGLEIEP